MLASKSIAREFLYLNNLSTANANIFLSFVPLLFGQTLKPVDFAESFYWLGCDNVHIC